jgi:hypothetical protein
VRERVGVFYARRASEGTQILQIKAALARLWWRQQRYGRLRTFIHERLPGGPDLLRSTTIRTYVLCSHWLSGSTGQPPWSWGLGLSTTWGTHEAAAEEVVAEFARRARPNSWRFSILRRLIGLPPGPELQGQVTPALTAASSPASPVAKRRRTSSGLAVARCRQGSSASGCRCRTGDRKSCARAIASATSGGWAHGWASCGVPASRRGVKSWHAGSATGGRGCRGQRCPGRRCQPDATCPLVADDGVAAGWHSPDRIYDTISGWLRT